MGATEEMKMKKDGWCQSGRISSSGLVATSERIHNRADRFNAAAPSRIHTHTGHWLHTGWKRPSPWLWKKCRCFVCSSKWEPECVRWTLAGCVMLVVARAGRSSILVLCGGQRAAAVMVDTSYNNYRLQGRGRNIEPLRLHQQTEAGFLCLYLCLCAPLPWWMNLQADGMVQKWVSFFRRQGSCFRDQCGF